MKTLKKIILIVVVVFLAFKVVPFFVFYNDPPIDYVTETSPQKYIKVNRYVRGLMEKGAQNFFPDSIPTEAEADYCYHYQCSVLGDPGCAVYLSLSYHDRDAYCREVKRIQALEVEDIVTIGENEYIIFNQIHKKSLECYFDEVNHVSVNNEYIIAVKNENDMRMEYVYAFIGEESIKPEKLIDILEPLYKANYGLQ